MDAIEDPGVQGDHLEPPPAKWIKRGGKNGNQGNFPKYQDNRHNNNGNRRFQNYSNPSYRPYQQHERDGNRRFNSRGGYRRRNPNRENQQQNNDSTPNESSEFLLETGGPKITPFSTSNPVVDENLPKWIASSREFPAPFPPVKSDETNTDLPFQVPYDFNKVETDHQHSEQLSPTDEGIGIPVETSSLNSSLSIRHSSGDERESHVDADRSNVSGYCSGVTEKLQETQAQSSLAISLKSTSLADVSMDFKTYDLEGRAKKLVETLKIWDSESPKELQHNKSADIKYPEGNVNVKAPPGFEKPFKNNNHKPKRGRGDHKLCSSRQWSKKHNKDIDKNPLPSPLFTICPHQPQQFFFPVQPNLYQQQSLNLASKANFPTRQATHDPNVNKKLEQSFTPKPLPSFHSTAQPHMFNPSNLCNRNFPAGDQKLQQRPTVSNIKDITATLQQARTPSWQPNLNFNTQTHYGPTQFQLQPTQFQNVGCHQTSYIPTILQTQVQNSLYNNPISGACQVLENESRSHLHLSQADFSNSGNFHSVIANTPNSFPPHTCFPPPVQRQSLAFTPYPFFHSAIHHHPEPERYHANGTLSLPRNQSQCQYFPSPTASSGEMQYQWMPPTHYQHVLPVSEDGSWVPYLVPSIYPDPAIHSVIGPSTIETRLAEDPAINSGSQQSSLNNDLLAVDSPFRYETGSKRQ